MSHSRYKCFLCCFIKGLTDEVCKKAADTKKRIEIEGKVKILVILQNCKNDCFENYFI